jgi:hypothetical protein
LAKKGKLYKEQERKDYQERKNKGNKPDVMIIFCLVLVRIPAGVCKGAAGPRASRLAQAAELKANIFLLCKARHRIVFMCTVFAYRQ